MEALNELALFAGAGGGILGGKILGWRTVCAVEIEEYPRSVLIARQNDGSLNPFPIWDDVCTFDGKPWRGTVDVVSGGFPCQDISAAGNGAGLDGERSGLWGEMARIIGEVRPRFAFVENSPLLVGRGLAVVLGDLAALGYDARWCVLGGTAAGLPAKRDRIWIVASSGVLERDSGNDESEIYKKELYRQAGSDPCERDPYAPGRTAIRIPKRARVDYGLAHWMESIRAVGNGQMPALASLAWEILRQGHDHD